MKFLSKTWGNVGHIAKSVVIRSIPCICVWKSVVIPSIPRIDASKIVGIPTIPRRVSGEHSRASFAGRALAVRS